MAVIVPAVIPASNPKLLGDPKRERVIVTFDARKTPPPDLHDAILKNGYKPAPVAD